MTDETTRDEEFHEEAGEMGAESTRAMAGPCNVWPPFSGCCGQGKAWVRIGGRWICKPQPGCP